MIASSEQNHMLYGAVPVVAHLLAHYDEHEAQAATIARIVAGVPAVHHLVAGSIGHVTAPFASTTELGGSPHTFGWLNAADIAAQVDALGADVVHFHGGPVGALSAARSWSAGRPSVVSIYLWSRLEQRLVRYPSRWVEMRRSPVLAPRTWAFTALPAGLVATTLQRAGVRTALLHDGAAFERLSRHGLPVSLVRGLVPPRAQRPVPSQLRFVFAGRAEFSRGADVLANAIAVLRARGIDASAEFHLLDNGGAAALAATLDKPGCSVSVGPCDLAEVFSGATAVVLPFRFDSTTLTPNMVAAEAMSYGVPVVGSDVACLRGIVDDGRTGLLVRPDRPGELADALARLTDTALVERLGRGAFDEVERRWSSGSVATMARWAYETATAPSLWFERRAERMSESYAGVAAGMPSVSADDGLQVSQ